MSEEFDYTPELYTLEDEDGVEQEFELIDKLEVEGSCYYAFIPYAPNPEELLNSDGELVILKEIEDGDEVILATIDNDEEYNRIGEIFLARIGDAYDECDCDECGEDCECGEDECDEDECGDGCCCEECNHE